MPFELYLTDIAKKQFLKLKEAPSLKKRFKAVSKTLKYLANDPRHPGLNTHEYSILSRDFGEKVFEAYAENHTPGAYRVFWHYGDKKNMITILYITPHP